MSPLRTALYGFVGLLTAAALAGLTLMGMQILTGDAGIATAPVLPAGVPGGNGPQAPEHHEAMSSAATETIAAQLQRRHDIQAAEAKLAALRLAIEQATRDRGAPGLPNGATPQIRTTATASLPPDTTTAPPAGDAVSRRVFIHYRAGSVQGAGEASDLARRLAGSAFTYAQTRIVPGTPSRSTIRYFYPDDAAAAARLAAFLRNGGGPFYVQNMLAFRPSPAPHTLEVWVSH